MGTTTADGVVDGFLRGEVSRRELVATLMGLGAAAATGTRIARAAQDAPTFRAVSVDHIALSVTDLERSRAWYERHLGLTTTSRDASSVFLDAGDDFVALFKGETPGLHHFSFGIRNYDQQENARRLRAAGLEPKLRGGRTYFDDPDGIEVQVSGV
ncbi:MAG: VOC family protein [Phycisphaerales bacterium]